MKKALIVSNVTKRFMPGHFSMIEPLEKLGYEVHWAADFSMYEEDIKEVPCIIHQIDFIRNPFNPKNLKAYRQLSTLISMGFDVVHCQSPVGGLIGRLVSNKFKVKNIIYTAHGFHFYKGAPLKNWLLYYPVEKFMLNMTDCIITINEEDYKLGAKLNSLKTKKIPGIGIDTQLEDNLISKIELRDELGIAKDDCLLIAVGEVNANKNHKAIIKAISKLNNKKIKFIICGVGPLKEELEELVLYEKLSEQVKFLGYRTDVNNLYKISNIFLLPSFREGLSRSMMEAMSSGLPCIASKIRGNTDLISNSYGGFLVDPNDIQGFSNCINELYESKEKCKSMGQYNKEVVAKYDVENVKKEMLKIYKEVIER